jgi:hypothetical protein
MDRFARGFPKHPEGEPAFYGPFSEAASTTFGFDAHFCAYSQPTIARRLAEVAALAYEPKMVAFIVDVDGPDHKCTPEWWAGERAKIRGLFKASGWGYAYTTRGGYRIVYGLHEELVLRSVTDAARWRVSYLDWIAGIQRDHQILCDDKCADWTRLYRLPRVMRDGVPNTPAEEIGAADRMSSWREPYVAADDPRCMRADVTLEVPEPAPIDEERQLEAARALAAAWPHRNRHYAGLALCGALARAGWSEGAIVDFAASVFFVVNGGDPWIEEAQASARSSVDKVARGESVAGWDSLASYLCSGIDGQVDEGRRALVESAVLACRRAIGQGPPSDLFEGLVSRPASAATASADIKALLGLTQRDLKPENTDAALAADLAAVKAELSAGPDFNAILDEVASILPAQVKAAESKAETVDPTPMGLTYRELIARDAPPPEYLIDYLIPKHRYRRAVGRAEGRQELGRDVPRDVRRQRSPGVRQVRRRPPPGRLLLLRRGLRGLGQKTGSRRWPPS